MLPNKQICLSHIALHPESFRREFKEWIMSDEGWEIFVEFDRHALQKAHRRERYGARTIMEILRYYSILRDSGEYKIDNDKTPDCARLFSLLHPEYKRFFAFRRRPEPQQKISYGISHAGAN